MAEATAAAAAPTAPEAAAAVARATTEAAEEAATLGATAEAVATHPAAVRLAAPPLVRDRGCHLVPVAAATPTEFRAEATEEAAAVAALPAAASGVTAVAATTTGMPGSRGACARPAAVPIAVCGSARYPALS